MGQKLKSRSAMRMSAKCQKRTFRRINVAIFSYWLSSIRKNASISGELDVNRIENASVLRGSAPTTLAKGAGHIFAAGADELHFEVAQYRNWLLQTDFCPLG
jgi:hypothetical protein